MSSFDYDRVVSPGVKVDVTKRYHCKHCGRNGWRSRDFDCVYSIYEPGPCPSCGKDLSAQGDAYVTYVRPSQELNVSWLEETFNTRIEL
jgi:hypothetical protein